MRPAAGLLGQVHASLALLITVGIMLMMQFVGRSAALGIFLAGVVLVDIARAGRAHISSVLAGDRLCSPVDDDHGWEAPDRTQA